MNPGAQSLTSDKSTSETADLSAQHTRPRYTQPPWNRKSTDDSIAASSYLGKLSDKEKRHLRHFVTNALRGTETDGGHSNLQAGLILGCANTSLESRKALEVCSQTYFQNDLLFQKYPNL